MNQVLLLLSINNTRARLVQVCAAAGTPGLVELYLGPTTELDEGALRRAVEKAGITPGRLVLSSVAPPAEQRIAGWLAEYRVTRVSPDLQLNFSLARYPGRAKLGADRIACLAAVAEHHTLPAIILDLGTAVTVDVLDAQREYLGGMIAPGLRLYSEYLPDRTALLPRLAPGEFPAPTNLGQDTVSAMAAGVYHGFGGMLRGLVAAAEPALAGGPPHSVVVTGGDAALLKNALGAHLGQLVHAPLLAFEGMRLLGELNPSPEPR